MSSQDVQAWVTCVGGLAGAVGCFLLGFQAGIGYARGRIEQIAAREQERRTQAIRLAQPEVYDPSAHTGPNGHKEGDGERLIRLLRRED